MTGTIHAGTIGAHCVKSIELQEIHSFECQNRTVWTRSLIVKTEQGTVSFDLYSDKPDNIAIPSDKLPLVAGDGEVELKDGQGKVAMVTTKLEV